MTSYIRDIIEDVVEGHIREGEDTYVAVNPLFHIMALGLFMAIGLNKGNTTLSFPCPRWMRSWKPSNDTRRAGCWGCLPSTG